MYTLPEYFENIYCEPLQPPVVWLGQETAVIFVWTPVLQTYVPCILMFNYDNEQEEPDFISLGWDDDDDDFFDDTDDFDDDDDEDDLFDDDDDEEEDDDDFFDDDDDLDEDLDDDLDDDLEDDLDDDLIIDDDEDEF